MEGTLPRECVRSLTGVPTADGPSIHDAVVPGGVLILEPRAVMTREERSALERCGCGGCGAPAKVSVYAGPGNWRVAIALCEKCLASGRLHGLPLASAFTLFVKVHQAGMATLAATREGN